MLTFLVRTAQVPVEQPDDVYSSAVGLLFPDNIRTFHGDPGSYVTYLSKRFGDIKLIWNSGIQMAEFISQASDEAKDEKDERWNVEGETVLELGAGP